MGLLAGFEGLTLVLKGEGGVDYCWNYYRSSTYTIIIVRQSVLLSHLSSSESRASEARAPWASQSSGHARGV